MIYNNPYAHNPNAIEKARVEEIHEGRLFTKISYELKCDPMTRLLKIIQAIALTIFTCFAALAFESVRKLWMDGIRGSIDASILISSNQNLIGAGKAALAPTILAEKILKLEEVVELLTVSSTEEEVESVESIFQGDGVFRDIEILITQKLPLEDLLAMRVTSKANAVLTQIVLVNRMNSGEIKFKNIVRVIHFFDNCNISKISQLKLKKPKDSDIELINHYFPKINCLSLEKPDLTPESAYPFNEMTSLSTLNLDCQNIEDLSFLQGCQNLKTLKLFECDHILDFSFVGNFKKLTSLNLSECWSIKNLTFLESCSSLKDLDLSYCQKIKDLSSLQSCTALENLNLKGCFKITDFNFLKNCQNLTTLSLKKCIQIQEISFLEPLKKLTTLDLTECSKIDNLSSLQQCPSLRHVVLNGCEGLHYKDMEALINRGIVVDTDLSFDSLDVSEDSSQESSEMSLEEVVDFIALMIVLQAYNEL